MLLPTEAVALPMIARVASLGFNPFGDGLRDVVEPALRGVDG
jgi:hypothetical protein